MRAHRAHDRYSRRIFRSGSALGTRAATTDVGKQSCSPLQHSAWFTPNIGQRLSMQAA
jgi:hypothetical protein